MNRFLRYVVLLVAALTIIGIFGAIGEGICARNEDASVNALKSMGFRDIKLNGWAAFACSQDDLPGLHFTATNPVGQPVSGVVCCGLLKSCTVRF